VRAIEYGKNMYAHEMVSAGTQNKKVKAFEVMGRVEYSRPSLDGDGESLVGGGGVEGTASSAACAPPSC
jgi:hypothetical protein